MNPEQPSPPIQQPPGKIVTPRWVDTVAVFVIAFALIGVIAIAGNWDLVSVAIARVKDNLAGVTEATKAAGEKDKAWTSYNRDDPSTWTNAEHRKRMEEVDKAVAGRQKAAQEKQIQKLRDEAAIKGVQKTVDKWMGVTKKAKPNTSEETQEKTDKNAQSAPGTPETSPTP